MAKRILFFKMMPKTKNTADNTHKAIIKYFIYHYNLVK